ncbi:MAG TPA: glycosyltransferase family 4 protein [Chloroflexia bacterium]|nr:glycosyltransferase family 4 protein [Chloroflexia bacterium]
MTAERICLISAEYPPTPGGVGDYTACLAVALAQAGRQVHVLTTRTDRAGRAEPTPPGVCVHRLVRDWGWGCWGDIARALRTLHPAVAVVQYQTGAYRLHGAINLLPWRLQRLPVAWVTTFHDLREPYLFPKAGRLRPLANAALMRGSRAIVVTNPQDQAALPAWARARARGIPIGANIAPVPPSGWDRAAIRGRYGVRPETILIAYFGFFNASKGLDTLLAALASLRRQGGAYHLLLVGGGSTTSDPTNAATEAALRRQIAALGLTTAVYWTGYLDPAGVSAALLSADLAALPFADGASLRRGSLLAVLAHGLPLVTTTPAPTGVRAADWPALAHGTNVLLVPPADPDALAAALARLADDAALRARLGAGAQTLAAQFDWGRIAAEYLALFDSLIRALPDQ